MANDDYSSIPGEIFGVDLASTDGAAGDAFIVNIDGKEVEDWFKSTPNDSIAIRVLCVRIRDDYPCSPPQITELLKNPLLSAVVEHAIWGSGAYLSLVDNSGGGAAGLLDEPWRFILRTPSDGGPFCTLAGSRKGKFVKAIYLYNSDDFNPAKLSGSAPSLSAWRGRGLQVVTLAQLFINAQTARSSRELADIVSAIASIESTLESATELPSTHPGMNRTLHVCSRRLIDIERRSRFENTTLDAIEAMVVSSQFGQAPWPAIMPQRTAISARAFEFESLPRRIENARATISGLIQQRNEQINLELARSSERIAEATFSDSKSMKAIAILTMVFLPATAVASLFSMDLFDWSSNDGGGIANKWLWVYFVVSVPLTVAVLTIWWFWGQRGDRTARRIFAARAAQDAERYVDVEAGSRREHEADAIELQTTQPNAKTVE